MSTIHQFGPFRLDADAERYDRSLGDIFALQDEVAMSVVGAIEPSIRRPEVERVTRKRPESLGAYDLALRALPDVYGAMPATVTKALMLLDRALAIEPTYATAHAYAAMCHHCLFLRNGLQEQNRAESIRHAQAALSHGNDDAVALTFAGFSLGMDGHDRAAAFAAFEAALDLSPSLALAYILGAQVNPGFGSSYMLLAAPLVKLGRLEEAGVVVAQLMEREPAFLDDALAGTGIPE